MGIAAGVGAHRREIGRGSRALQMIRLSSSDS